MKTDYWGHRLTYFGRRVDEIEDLQRRSFPSRPGARANSTPPAPYAGDLPAVVLLFFMAMFAIAPIAALFGTIAVAKFIHPLELTSEWVLGYVGIFILQCAIALRIVYVFRRIVAIALLIAIIAAISRFAWTMYHHFT